MKIFLAALMLSITLSGGFAHADDLSNAEDKVLIHEANVALAQKDYKTAFTKFSVLASHGKPEAQFNLGAFYLNGQGVQKDDKLAFEWFQKSAAQGNARALQVIEKAAAQGNVYAKNELKKMPGQDVSAQEPAYPQEKPQPTENIQPQEKFQPQPQANSRAIVAKLVYNEPTVAAPNKRAYGISADYSSFNVSEPLYYSLGGVLYNKTQSHSSAQPGVSFWAGDGDFTLLVSYRRGSGSVIADIQGAGSVSKSFKTSETEIDVRWLMRDYKTHFLTPYVLLGYILNSTSGTADEIQFQDTYSQKDNILLVGAGAIIPVNERMGFRVDGKVGADRQKRSGNYVPAPGVILSFDTYSYSATASYLHLAATMYYNLTAGWHAQLGVSHTNYAGGMGSASNTGINVKAGYTFR